MQGTAAVWPFETQAIATSHRAAGTSQAADMTAAGTRLSPLVLLLLALLVRVAFVGIFPLFCGAGLDNLLRPANPEVGQGLAVGEQSSRNRGRRAGSSHKGSMFILLLDMSSV